MAFKNIEQLGRVCATLTKRIPGAPWWAVRDDVDDDVPRPTDKAVEWVDGGAKRGEPWQRALLGFAWTIWNAHGEPRMAPIMALDNDNTRMLGELLVAMTEVIASKRIDEWIRRWEPR